MNPAVKPMRDLRLFGARPRNESAPSLRSIKARTVWQTLLAGAMYCLATPGAVLHSEPLEREIDARAVAVESRLIAWRRDIHEHPELGNQEVRTARLVSDHLRKLGLRTRTGVAGTGVVGVLEGGHPGPAVALRADMDALPVKEETGLAFASRAIGVYRGTKGPVMHACGHDAHVAILMATAEVLASMRAQLRGSVVFLFQPAEEGPADFTPDGQRLFGARQMVAEGALDDPKVVAVFGLHVAAGVRTGTLRWRSGPALSAGDRFSIRVQGRQTHGAMPWRGVDPVVLAAQIVLGLQTIQSRQVDVTKEPSILSIGQIHGGTRENIIPDYVDLEGTIRTYDGAMQDDIHRRIIRTATLIAESGGGSAQVDIVKLFPTTVNDPELSKRMAPTLKRVMGQGRWTDNAPKRTGAEDFPFYLREVPGLYVHLGVTPPDNLDTAAANHSPRFYIDEGALTQGVRVMASLAVEYLSGSAMGADIAEHAE
jgi:amidohydrolase